VSSEPWYRRQPVMLPGGRLLPPAFLYLAVAALYAGSLSMAFTTYGLYVVRAAELSPLQLVLAGVALEAAYFLFEVPTGVVADVYSRRLSIVVGCLVTAAGVAVMGATPAFAFVVAGQVGFGIGATFLSGASEAWLADEVGEDRAAPLYFSAHQWGRAGALVGIPLGVALAAVDLQLPMLAAGAALVVLAAALMLTMPERRYAPTLDGQRSTLRSMLDTTALGLRTVRRRPSLIALILVIGIVAGAGEGLVRLFPLYVLDVIGLPEVEWLSEEVWFGIFGVGGLVGGIAVTGLARRVTDLHRVAAIVRTLVVISVITIVSLFVFASAQAFWVMLAAYWIGSWAGAAKGPLQTAWINRGLDPRSRATVISIVGQADPLGQVAGGPAIGLVGALRGVRAAMFAVALAHIPTIPLYLFGLRQDRRTRREDGGSRPE
jgi:MFS transporter, DHA3 family, tetracycline resistance protein